MSHGFITYVANVYACLSECVFALSLWDYSNEVLGLGLLSNVQFFFIWDILCRDLGLGLGLETLWMAINLSKSLCKQSKP